MVQYRRSRATGGTCFFTVNLRDRRSAFLVEHIDSLRDILRSVHEELPLTIDAMAVLPDHWHSVWTLPQGDAGYARRIRPIKARFTSCLVRDGVNIAKDERGEYQLWQKRFWEHTIRDDRDLESHVNYVHFNPVKHGHGMRAIDWPHSTIHRYVAHGLLPANWADVPAAGNFGE